MTKKEIIDEGCCREGGKFGINRFQMTEIIHVLDEMGVLIVTSQKTTKARKAKVNGKRKKRIIKKASR